MSALALAGWTLLALVVVLVVLLAIPVDLAFSWRRGEGGSAGDLTVGWLFGVVRVPLRRVAGAESRAPAGAVGGRTGGRPRRALAMLQTEGFCTCLLKLVRGLVRHVRIHRLQLDVRLGLEDPADTGRLWGVVGALAVQLPRSDRIRIAVVPDFADAVLEIDGRGRIRLVPIRWVPVFLAFLLSPATLRVLRGTRA